MKIPESYGPKPAAAANVTGPSAASKDPIKQMEIQFFCDQLQKTIKDTEASAVAEARKARNKIQEES